MQPRHYWLWSAGYAHDAAEARRIAILHGPVTSLYDPSRGHPDMC